MTKGADTRKTILYSAMRMASTLGLEGLSLGSVAKEVSMSKSGLFAHFESKEDLQLQVLKTAADSFVELVISPAFKEARGEPRVRAFFDKWLDWEESRHMPGGCVFITTANEFDDRPGPLRDYLVGVQRDCLEAISNLAKIAISEGHFRKDLDTDQFAYDVYSIVLAFHHFHRLLRDPAAPERARRSFEAVIQNCR